MISLWEKESFMSYDVIIIGAGITGLSTAASLKETSSSLSILVLERGLLPTGASTKNAGFACFGSISELQNDRQQLGDEGMMALVEKRWKGLQKTINRLSERNIDFHRKGGYELLTPSQAPYLESIDGTNQLLADLFGETVFEQVDKKIGAYGFKGIEHLIYNPFEGQLHPGKLVQSLWNYCTQLGVRIITGAEVTHFEDDHKGVHVFIPGLTFNAKKLAICTNAFSGKFKKIRTEIKPGRGLVMFIKPATRVSFNGTFHYEKGYYYFRDYRDGIIFGGGRNLDFAKEETTEFGINQLINNKLNQLLQEMIIPGTKYEIDQVWSGIMAFGPNKSPVVESLSKNCFTGIRLGGMGVAIGSVVGDDLCTLILESGL